jgi:hypothetical protein
MSRFVIVTVASASAPLSRLEVIANVTDAADVETGCAWLFSADARVDDPEDAMRAAVSEYFTTVGGRRVRESEGMDRVGWCEAILWVPEEIWQRHGLTVFRHPDVERIILNDQEDLAEELSEVSGGESRSPHVRALSA